jgi:hypothetical protein
LPYVIVIGDDEIASKKLTVTVRKKSQPTKLFKEQMTPDALIAVSGRMLRASRSGRCIHPGSSR